MTVPELLAQVLRDHGAADALVVDDLHLSFADLEVQSGRLARQLLDAGIGKGGRVGLLFPNDERFVLAWLAVTRIGAVAVPISTLATASELARTVRHADVHLALSADSFRSHDYVARWEQAYDGVRAGAPFRLLAAPYLRGIWIWGDRSPGWATRVDLAREPDCSPALLAAVEAEVFASDPLSVIYTSGSTAEPKGVVHSHGTVLRQAAKQAAERGLTAQDRVFTPLPFFWVGGLTVALLACLTSGSATLVTGHADPERVLDFLERERLTFYLGWPHLARSLAAAASFPTREFSHVRGGNFHAALPPALRPTDLGLLNEGLGMTETAGPHTRSSSPQLPAALRGSFGEPSTGMDHRVVDPVTRAVLDPGRTGELQVRGDTLMLGLHKRERADYLDADGWYSTGDLVLLRDGNVFFQGRLDDLIKANGTNVSPREVEAVLTTFPQVAGAFVTGVSDDEGVTRVGAVVFSADGAAVSPADVLRHCREVLSSYKVPRYVVVLPADQVPTTASSKPDRLRLVQLVEGAAARGQDGRTRQGDVGRD
ncbi:MAG: hypothetical protein JWL64_883 [Frankiales bacterium]|nr:hypothetical protein [Frankiales bacterium]